MNKELLACITTARDLTIHGKGLLAADESIPTIQKRFSSLGIPCTSETRRVYRDLLVSTEGIRDNISGVILFDETLEQHTETGDTFPVYLQKIGIIPGVKVDKGLTPVTLSSLETFTEGLDGLARRLSTYNQQGIRFAKWRATIGIEGTRLPSRYALEGNAFTLARYASLCQQAGIMPVVEPEVLRDGDHPISRCAEVTHAILESLFEAMDKAGVSLEGMILKQNMVTSGAEASGRDEARAVATETLQCFLRVVPAAVPGVFFLSGGQTPEEATRYLTEMNIRNEVLPWAVSFSFGRALQNEALKSWLGDSNQKTEAQKVFAKRVKLVGNAARGAPSQE